VDVVEIGGKQLTSGSVYRVKPLGAYAMIDEGELDWKIICICVNDPLADKLHDIEDVERYSPPSVILMYITRCGLLKREKLIIG
jgi:inorganic pyrophosphatase